MNKDSQEISAIKPQLPSGIFLLQLFISCVSARPDAEKLNQFDLKLFFSLGSHFTFLKMKEASNHVLGCF